MHLLVNYFSLSLSLAEYSCNSAFSIVSLEAKIHPISAFCSLLTSLKGLVARKHSG